MGEVAFLQYQLLQLCQNALQTCPFTNAVTGADCTKKFCKGFPAYINVGTCITLLPTTDPKNCCALSDPSTCLASYYHGSNTNPSATPNVCASVLSILSTCVVATPTLLPQSGSSIPTAGPSATALAKCACYNTRGVFEPGRVDGFASECAASGSAAHPTYFPLVTPLQGFCTKNGNGGSAVVVVSTTTGTGASATATGGGVSAGTTSAASAVSSAESSATAAQTTTSRSDGFKITVRRAAVLLLGFSMLLAL